MRKLSRSQAGRCENSTGKRCRCRCGGASHGKARASADDLAQLPDDDPHYVARPARQLTIYDVLGEAAA
jgi:hypothetical protein